MPRNPLPDLLDGSIRRFRADMPGDWLRYKMLANQLVEAPSAGEAARRLLARDRRHDPFPITNRILARAADDIDYPSVELSPSQKNRAEVWELEQKFEQHLVNEGKAGRFVIGGTNARTGLEFRSTPSFFYVHGLAFDFGRREIRRHRSPFVEGVFVLPSSAGKSRSSGTKQHKKSPARSVAEDAREPTPGQRVRQRRDDAIRRMLATGVEPGSTMTWGEFITDLLRACGAPKRGARGFGRGAVRTAVTRLRAAIGKASDDIQ
jgi:hypothetical protein